MPRVGSAGRPMTDLGVWLDTLVVSVKKEELTEAEAMRRYTEYKAGGSPSHP
jgi:hypothetical protein